MVAFFMSCKVGLETGGPRGEGGMVDRRLGMGS